jgi:hypothetical protein
MCAEGFDAKRSTKTQKTLLKTSSDCADPTKKTDLRQAQICAEAFLSS